MSRALFLKNISEGLKSLLEKVDSKEAGKIVKGILIGAIGVATMKVAKEVMSENQIEDIPEMG